MWNAESVCDESIYRIKHSANNKQGRGKCYQPKPKAEADNTNKDRI